jgi:hypothetical protein
MAAVVVTIGERTVTIETRTPLVAQSQIQNMAATIAGGIEAYTPANPNPDWGTEDTARRALDIAVDIFLAVKVPG